MSTRTPTLDEIRSWAAVVSVEDGARALGISRSHMYELIRTDTCPVRVMKLGGSCRVITSSIVELLDIGH
ncbi:helix-turn-helix domain-containing protein [Streptomyces sp. NPDC057307]|uniref:helix-turn-helix domain-containing protein n=1 Tax=Streptomyces sp. NPDC057307 TaxID=3346096 RepID=UPI00363E0A5D